MTLESAGLAALDEAMRLWRSDIFDPPRTDYSPRAQHSKTAIESLLRACGWTWEIPYKGDGAVEWCGIFAGACWRAAGLDQKWLATYFASTYRLDTWARYHSFSDKHPNEKPATGPYRLLAEFDPHSTTLPWEPQAGDILMIGDGAPAYGDHITLVESYADGVFQTVEGNGVGLGPDGKRRQGVVRATRHLGGTGYCARRLIRPAASDMA